MSNEFEIGLFTTGELVAHPSSGRVVGSQQRIRDIVAAGRMADEAGLDVFAVGENHEPDYAASAHTVILGALAASTKRIRLASATTGISTADPVRVFQEFATVDAVSNGRAEIMAGRGARPGAYRLFGWDMDEYDELFAEKLELLLQLTRNERVTWRGRFRPPLQDACLLPRPTQRPIPVWVGILGSPHSAARAGTLGLPLTVAVLGGAYAPYRSVVQTYREAAARAGHDPERLKVAVTAIMHVQKHSQDAVRIGYPYYAAAHEHFFGTRASRSEFVRSMSPDRAPMIGSPQQIVEEMLYQHELFGHRRVLGQIDIGGMSLSEIETMIDVIATEVAPVVKREIAKRQKAPTGANAG